MKYQDMMDRMEIDKIMEKDYQEIEAEASYVRQWERELRIAEYQIETLQQELRETKAALHCIEQERAYIGH